MPIKAEAGMASIITCRAAWSPYLFCVPVSGFFKLAFPVDVGVAQ